MGENKINEGIKKLADVGLNLFTSAMVLDLPIEVLAILDEQKIPYEKDDTICLIGHGGKTLWKNLPHPLNSIDHPIDSFSIKQMQWFAKDVLNEDIKILFPHKKWNIPLQRIARFMNLSHPSLLGLDINRDYGVWFAFRGVLLTKKKIETRPLPSFSSPCESCMDKPCQKACPANALKGINKFNLSLCFDQRMSVNSSCRDKCSARLSCTYKSEHQYDNEQIRYHGTILIG